MADADKKMRLEVEVGGAEEVAASLHRVADANEHIASSTKGGLDAAREQASTVKEGAENMNRMERASEALSAAMEGRLVESVKLGATAFRGLFALMAENPFLVILAALPIMVEGFGKLRETVVGNSEEIKKRNEETAANTEQMAKRVEEALSHPGQTQWAEKYLADAAKIDTANQNLITQLESVYTAYNNVTKAITEQTLSKIKMYETEDVRIAQSKGASSGEIDQIKLGYQLLRDKASAQGANEQAQAEVSGRERMLNNLQDQLTTAEQERATANKDIETRHANSKAQMDIFTKKYDEDIAASEAREKTAHDSFIAQQLRLGNARNPADAETQYKEEGIGQDERDLRDRLKKEYDEKVKSYDNAVAKPKPEDTQRMSGLEDQITKLQIQIDAAKLELQAARINAVTVAQNNVTTSVDHLADADQQAAAARARAAATQIDQGVNKARKDPRNAGLEPLLDHLQKAAQEVEQNPTGASIQELEKAIRDYGSAVYQRFHTVERGLLNLTLQFNILSKQVANGRDRNS